MENNLKVLFFSSVKINIGNSELKGTGNWVASLINTLSIYASKIKIFVAFHDIKARKIEYIENEGKTFIRIPYDYRNNRLNKVLNNWLIRDPHINSLDKYISITEKVNPDIIQIFGLETPFIRIFNNTSIPVVIHIQGLLAPYSFKHYLRFTNKELFCAMNFLDFIKGNLPIFHKIRMNKHIKLERTVYKYCRYFLGRTDWDRQVSRAIAPKSKYFSCQELFREEFYKNQWKPNNNKTLKIYTTTSDLFYKNVDIIFEVIKILEEYNIEFDFEWRVAGINESDITVRIMQKRGFNSKKLSLLGRLSAKEIIKEMLKADLFIFPSAIENSPNALQEAMLIGMPIIATYAGGVSSLIENKVTGIMVPEGEPYSLAGAIIEVKNNYNKIYKIGANAREIASKRNNPKNVIDSLLFAYKEILEDNKILNM